MKTVRSHGHLVDGRYTLDFGMCSAQNGYCQIDTAQDASYFGQWTNPEKMDIVKYMEGDLEVHTAENEKEYVEAIRRLAKWNEEYQEGLKIDCYTQPRQKALLEEMGLSDLLH